MMNPEKYSLTESLEALTSSTGGDISAMMSKLRLPERMPSEDLAILRKNLLAASNGDTGEIKKFAQAIAASQKGLLETTRGGVNKFETHWWGYQLYISHPVIEKIDSGMEWVDAVAFVASTCGAPIEVIDLILGALSIELLLLNTLVDQGNGVKISYLWVPVGLCVPLPQ